MNTKQNFKAMVIEITEWYEDNLPQGYNIDNIYPCSDYKYMKGGNGGIFYGGINNVTEILEIKRRKQEDKW